MKISVLRILLGIQLLLSASGCLSTEIEAPAPLNPEAVARLGNLASFSLFYGLETIDVASLGHQYLFFFIPWGRIEGSPWDFVRPQLETQASLRGLQLIPTSLAPQIIFRVESISVSAYDYFFSRHIVAKLELCAVFPWGRTCEQGEQSSWNALGFAPQLAEALDKASASAAAKLISSAFPRNTRAPGRS